jgi:hypothetical protein
VSPGGLWDWGGEFFVVGRFAKTHRNAGNQFCCKATERNGGRIHPKFSPIRQNKFDGENLLYNALKPELFGMLPARQEFFLRTIQINACTVRSAPLSFFRGSDQGHHRREQAFPLEAS